MSCCKSTELKRQLQRSVALFQASFSSIVCLSDLDKVSLGNSPLNHPSRVNLVNLKYFLNIFHLTVLPPPQQVDALFKIG